MTTTMTVHGVSLCFFSDDMNHLTKMMTTMTTMTMKKWMTWMSSVSVVSLMHACRSVWIMIWIHALMVLCVYPHHGLRGLFSHFDGSSPLTLLCSGVRCFAVYLPLFIQNCSSSKL
ncbi:hypothetical protein BC829DRAFT_393933, partial [Chytridium lagenaria]